MHGASVATRRARLSQLTQHRFGVMQNWRLSMQHDF